MSSHGLGYRDLNPDQFQQPVSGWKVAAAAVTALAVVGAIGAGIAHNIRQADAAVAAYKQSPVVLPCTDPLTKADVSVRAADIAARPNAIAEAGRLFGCTAKTL